MDNFNITDTVDITDVVCPLTFVKAKVAIEELDFLDETVKMDSKNLKIEDNNNDKSNENDYNVPKIISVIDGDMQWKLLKSLLIL